MLDKVKDLEVWVFVEKCLVKVFKRFFVRDFLVDLFL